MLCGCYVEADAKVKRVGLLYMECRKEKKVCAYEN